MRQHARRRALNDCSASPRGVRRVTECGNDTDGGDSHWRGGNATAKIEKKVDDFGGRQCSAHGDGGNRAVDGSNERTMLVRFRWRALVTVYVETSTFAVRTLVGQTPLHPHCRHRPDDAPGAHHPEGMKTHRYPLGTFDA